MFSTRKEDFLSRPKESNDEGLSRSSIKFVTIGNEESRKPSIKLSYSNNICKYCRAEFPNHNKLRLHSKIHILNKALRCSFPACKKTFKTFKGLNLHLKRHPGYAYYKCKSCEDSFFSLKELRDHNWKIHIHRKRRQIFKCKDCTVSFRNFNQLKKHKKEKSHILRENSIFVIKKLSTTSTISSGSGKGEDFHSLAESETQHSVEELNEYYDYTKTLMDVFQFKSYNLVFLLNDLGTVDVQQVVSCFLSSYST